LALAQLSDARGVSVQVPELVPVPVVPPLEVLVVPPLAREPPLDVLVEPPEPEPELEEPLEVTPVRVARPEPFAQKP
jgi:hypothetical protein